MRYVSCDAKKISILRNIILILILFYISIYTTFHRMSDYDNVYQTAAQWLDGSPYRLDFDVEMERFIIPRPTVVLKNVRLVDEKGMQVASAGEVRIGVAWKSVFRQPEIEKLVVRDAAGILQYDPESGWNISRLKRGLDNGQVMRFNRVLLENSNFVLRYGQNRFILSNFHLKTKRESGNYRYGLETDVSGFQWQGLTFQAAGVAQTNQNEVILPDAAAHFTFLENSHQISGSARASLRLGSEKADISSLNIKLDSKQPAVHVDASIQKILHSFQQTQFKGIDSVLTDLSGSHIRQVGIHAADMQWRDGGLESPEISTVAHVNTPAYGSFDIRANGKGSWHVSNGLLLENFEWQTVPNDVSGSRPVFASQWEGTFAHQGDNRWTLKAKGLFDRQPAALFIKRDNDTVSGQIELAKLNLHDYLDKPAVYRHAYPAWLSDNRKLDMDVRIGALEWSGVSVRNIRSKLSADAQNIRFAPLYAELYGGATQGELSVRNAQPLVYRLNQRARNIDIQPALQDVFGFSRVRGRAQMTVDIGAQGSTREEMLSSLSGSLKIDISEGALRGINLSQKMKQLFRGETVRHEAESETAFNRFSLTAEMNNGVSRNHSYAKIVSPRADLESRGEADLLRGEIREDVLISRSSQYTPLPIRISGKTSRPVFALNYRKITEGLASDEDKQRAVSEALKQQWQWLLQ